MLYTTTTPLSPTLTHTLSRNSTLESQHTLPPIYTVSRSEIILGTSMGLLYVLEGDTGTVKRFFPLQFHEIQVKFVIRHLFLLQQALV